MPASCDDILHLIQPGWIGVEVGVAEGHSAVAFLAKGCFLYLVDAWVAYEGYPEGSGEGVFEECMRNISPSAPNWNILRGFSADMAAMVPEVDFTWIDANHRYEWVKADLEAYFPKVKVGGLFAGHDYANSGHCEVKRAVDEFAAAHGLKVETSGGSWYIWKR